MITAPSMLDDRDLNNHGIIAVTAELSLINQFFLT
jgi:hypothetical protein